MKSTAEAYYQLQSTLPNTKVLVKFDGRFQQQNIVWDLSLFTLHRYYAEHSTANENPNLVRQFMTVNPSINRIYSIIVALALSTIDEPAIRKTIIMIKQYKNLTIGTHKWGKPVLLNSFG